MGFHKAPNTYTGEVRIKVKDVKRSLAFYKEVIGFNVLNETEHTAELTADGKNVLLSIEQPPNIAPKQQGTAGLYHFALLLPDRSDLGRVLQHLVHLNIPLGASDHHVSEAIYLNDPDGNGIEIYSDRDASKWIWQGSQVAMTTETLDAQGVLAEAKGEPWHSLPENTVMGHVHLHVSSLKETEAFYDQGLGFKTVARYGRQAMFMSTGGYHHHLGLNTWAGEGAPAPAPESAGLDWFTLIYPDADAVEQAVARLKNMGAKTFIEDGFVMTADPSGNRIRLIY
ncbi:VOC family protein [Metabacillus indicus]|uniref:VOC family protein n=1 Tax=Metabacillus indicus TaxID=246786 RepID=UPI002A02B017|nr:VOC family protein [Metabacillus indicus]MDX8290544.1 VOC family protein [Metabacillus indicus]